MPRRKLTAAERPVNFNARIHRDKRSKYARVCRKERLSQAKKLEQIIDAMPSP